MENKTTESEKELKAIKEKGINNNREVRNKDKNKDFFESLGVAYYE